MESTFLESQLTINMPKVYVICPECNDDYYGWTSPISIKSTRAAAIDYCKKQIAEDYAGGDYKTVVVDMPGGDTVVRALYKYSNDEGYKEGEEFGILEFEVD